MLHAYFSWRSFSSNTSNFLLRELQTKCNMKYRYSNQSCHLSKKKKSILIILFRSSSFNQSFDIFGLLLSMVIIMMMILLNCIIIQNTQNNNNVLEWKNYIALHAFIKYSFLDKPQDADIEYLPWSVTNIVNLLKKFS